jgi:hypothetical protein
MNNRSFSGRTNSSAQRATGHDASPGGKAVAFAPPAYGIDFVDRATRSHEAGQVVQRYNWTYGNLSDESGTEMKTELIEANDTGGGSDVSVWPSWWPAGGAETANDFLRENFVQGHLLNNRLGGPGDERYNLTPLTRSANSQMYHTIEKVAWSYLEDEDDEYAIEYWVTADYASNPNVDEVGAGDLSNAEQLKLQTELDKMAGKVESQITVYEPDGYGGWEKLPDKKQPLDEAVLNEGAALKGSFD